MVRNALLAALRASLVALLLSLLGGPAYALPSEPPAAAGAFSHVLVAFRASASASDRARAVAGVDGWVDQELPRLGITRLAVPSRAAALARLRADPAVVGAEEDATVRLAFTPNDPYFFTDPYTALGQWGLRTAKVDRAWDLTRGSASVTVAVLDTGVDPGHPDLAGSLVAGAAFVSDASPECAPGTTKDDNSHGTHVAGIVAAQGNNALGIAGVAFGVKVMPLKVLDCTGTGTQSDIARAMTYAVDNGARIVNLSLGSTSDSFTLRSAVTYATSRNVLVVSAVGNCHSSSDRCVTIDEPQYPAAYPDVLGVAATDSNDQVAFFSSRNSTVDISAPGRSIVSTTPTYPTYMSRQRTNPATLNYAAFSGTSQAAPFVAGVAALLLSQDPTLTPAAIIQRLTTTADDLGAPGRDDSYGYGRVNAFAAVSAGPAAERYGATYDTRAVPAAVPTGGDFIAKVGLTNSSSFTWRAAGTDAVKLAWSWLDASGRPLAGPAGSLALPSDVAAGGSIELTGKLSAPAAAGAATLRLDLVRGTTAFSTKGALAAALAVNVGSGYGASYETATGTASSFDAGSATQVSVVVTNTGSEPWPAGGPKPVHLSYHWLKDGKVAVWDGQRALLPGDVLPGGRVTLTLPLLVPEQAGAYTLRVELVQEGRGWFTELGAKPLDLAVSVRAGFVATYQVPQLPVVLPGGTAVVTVTVTNSGTSLWPAGGPNPVRLATHLVDPAGNMLVWDGPRTLLPADVAPGASVKLELAVDAPRSGGAYTVRVDLVREGIAWFSGLGVAPAQAALLVAEDRRAQLPTGPLAVSRAQGVVALEIKNTSLATWTTAGSSPVHVSVHFYDASGKLLVWDGPRTSFADPVAPGATVALPVKLGPIPEGAAFAAIDLVQEGQAWFGAGSLRPLSLVP